MSSSNTNSAMDAIYRDLTDPQREAVCHRDGPLLILAGPGSGKTRVITHRIAHMLANGIPAWQIAGLTFTNKAAAEMRERVGRLAPGQSVWLGTFHRFCAQLLRRYASLVGLKENYSIYDTADSKSAMKRAIKRAGVSTDFITPGQIASSISRLKNRIVTPSMLEGVALSSEETVVARVYPVYRQMLFDANAVDFDDLLLHVAMLLREHPEIRQELDARFRYVMVDEYQDTNLAQYAIVRALSIDYPNLAVTGDPDQSIYGWRGADLNNILDFEKDYPAVKTVRLEQNYRSTPNILRVADQLVHHNRRRKSKTLFTGNGEGEPVVLRVYEDGKDEGQQIIETIAHRIENEGLRPRDFAIFFRMNYLTHWLENALRRIGLPYQIVNGTEFYKRKEVKDLLAYLHLINNPDHDAAFERIINTPPRGIGAKTLTRIQQHADRNGLSLLEAARDAAAIESLGKRPLAMVQRFVTLLDRLAMKATASIEDLMRSVVEETAYETYLEKLADGTDDLDRSGNVGELITDAVEFDRKHPEDGTLELYLEQASLVADTDAFEEENDRITMMTLHAAKGLEFPHVFIIAVEDETLPHYRSQESDEQFEEERRLLFVGITRAMQRLQLSFCKRRSSRGQERPVIPSPFLNELPQDELQFIDPTVFSSQSFAETFDLEESDSGYPDAWDFEGDTDSEGDATADSVREAEAMCQLPEAEQPPASGGRDRQPAPGSQPSVAALTTAANLMSGGAVSLADYRAGTSVRHPTYGEGTILTVTGRGPKRTAQIQFESGTIQFRLAFADLELL